VNVSFFDRENGTLYSLGDQLQQLVLQFHMAAVVDNAVLNCANKVQENKQIINHNVKLESIKLENESITDHFFSQYQTQMTPQSTGVDNDISSWFN